MQKYIDDDYAIVLGHPLRLGILCELSTGPKTVSELNKTFPVSQTNLSQHLKKMRELGFLSTKRKAQFIHYKISDKDLLVVSRAIKAKLYNE